MKKTLIFVLVALFIVTLSACGEAEIKKANSESKSSVEDKQNKETQELAIGDTVDFDGVKLTLNEARVENGGEFDTPQNEKFVVVNLTAENTTDKEETMSSMLNVELKDNDGYSYNTTILVDGIKAQFDGQVQPGGTLRGEIPFDVPNSDSYELHFSNPFKSGKAIWKIPGGKLAK